LPRPDLAARLVPFLDRRLLGGVPTSWQIFQGAVEMFPHVVTPDVDDRRRYAGAPLGHPIVRTPFLVAYTLGGHFQVGSGLGSSARTLEKHLLAVYHFGQPVYDLQLAQTFPDGLERVRRAFLRVRDRASPLRRVERAFVGAVIPRWDEYCAAMLGHVDRAASFDYDAPPSWARPEFWSLTAFLDHCVRAFPPHRAGENAISIARRLFRLMRNSRR
jgi:hypothetical protein